MTRTSPSRRALIALEHGAARDYLELLVSDHGFAVDRVDPGQAIVPCGHELFLGDLAGWLESGAPAAIVLSERPTEEEARAAITRGALDYLALPFEDPRRVLVLLGRVIARAASKRFQPGEIPDAVLV